ncbi:hypothetical protein N7474_009342 [Penicillium riverlandense]|uniref:uncharacterized protein n=1 Tax=Penicillium riverlandense TaxID=1903569 RepID=UPI002546D0AA|nr:uncharacterized protein N7474_009342 [Penicillium riverlandense]KAJ5808073.1 hypothetical protein N7474_009342 [Penicillium riverlandense]
MGKGPLERQHQFEKKNQNLVKLPKNAKVSKRPIPHAPIASPYAGATVPKIVYVSSSTPFMSAVKRVQKLLRQAEKRDTAAVSLEDTRTSEKQKLAELAKIAGAEKREEIFVKATGRAIERALGVGKWFEERGGEFVVRVKTGSVLVVDDVVEGEKKSRNDSDLKVDEGVDSAPAPDSKASDSDKKRKRRADDDSADMEELPETRTRWIKMVEVAISLK